MRTLVADPATDFAALDADAFFAALQCACQEGTVNRALIADVKRRLAEGTATSRDLHQVLFTAGDDAAWQHARNAAMAAVAHQPHLAVEVVHLEVQRLGAPPPHVTELARSPFNTAPPGATATSASEELSATGSADQGGFTAQASLDRGGVTVEGWPCADTSKKRASQRALVSLLVELTGIPVDAAVDAPPAPASTPTTTAPATGPEDLEAWLDHMVGCPEPDPELSAHLAAGRLTPRALYLLLFEADPAGWRQHRAHAWSTLAAAPSQAPGVLSMCTQDRRWPPAGCVETGASTAVAYVTTPEGPVVGEPAVAGGLRAARASAALALVRDLAPPIQGDGAPEPPIGGGNPVSLLNERAQVGLVGDLTYTQDAAGPAHRPVFTCTATCVHGTQPYTSTAEAGSKNEAKSAAAAGLLEQIVAAEHTHLARLARARREQARSPEGIFSRLARAGCPVEFTGQGLRITGHLAEPLAGCELPLRSALPVLATLDGPIDPTARTWASATKVALEAVAARRVYPAVDGEGRDCWRLAPHVSTPAPDPAIAQFFDAVADELLRPPGAPLVIGDRPYAGHPRPLDPEATDWADRAAEAAEGTAPAHLVIRLGLPEGDGRPLRAHLRTGRSPEVSPSGGETSLTRAEQRLLRRAAREWLPLERVRSAGVLTGAESAQLLGPAGERLAALGITAEWPAELLTPGTVAAHIGVAPRSATGSGTFSLADTADLTWQLDLDGEPLTEQETRAAADAVAGVLQLRGRWVVLDAETQQRARDRRAGRLSGVQAVAAALTGQVTVGGRNIACRGTEALADLVSVLRGASSGLRGAGSGPHDVVLPGGLEATLRDYQRRGVRWLVRLTSAGFGALLADDMGLGKTLTVIAYRLVRTSTAPSLVVCPASLLGSWEREFARFAPGVAVRRYHGAGRSVGGLTPGEVVVTTYGTLLRDAGILAGVPWDLVVADEAQQVKNHRSQASRALRLLRPAVRVAVTGTPVENSLSELWSILDWTNPGLFGSLAAFRDRFGRAAEREAVESGADRESARRLGRLIAPFVLRRRKSDPTIAPELPDKVVSDRYVELSREQAALYEAVTAESLGRIAASDGPARRGQVLRLLQSLRQICNSPAHYLREAVDGWDADRQAARSGKLQALDELIEAIVPTGEAALIFTGYVSMGHLVQAHLAARGVRADFLHGGVPVVTRQQIVDRFQTGHGDALVLSVRAAGTGLTLTRAGHVIHVDRPWNPAVEDQATDRAHRIGQHRLVEVHHLIAEGTVEDRIADLLARKRELTEAVLAGGETALTELSDRELSALVRLGTEPSVGGRP